MQSSASWFEEFSKVLTCDRCSLFTDKNLLRDQVENVPQPGWVGQKFKEKRVLLVGQNPGTPKSLAEEDRPYTKALRALRDNPTAVAYLELTEVLRGFIPRWPVHGSYFPLDECGLSLDDIAYFNIVRCRTAADRAPGKGLVSNCLNSHFGRWLNLFNPAVVIFIGKWAAEQGGPIVARAGIPYSFMNRQRSLSSLARQENRRQVTELVLKCIPR